MEACLEDMSTWMAEHHLKLNAEKTEFLVMGTKAQTKKIQEPLVITIGDESITASEKARNIGAVMDNELNMIAHVNNVSKSCYVHLRNIGRIRPNLTEDAAATLVHSFIASKLDNLNSLLYGIPDKTIKKLQLIQNNAARIVTRSRKYDHITPILKRLHWLPVSSRIQYKICMLTFKCLHGKAPMYLAEMLTPYRPTRALRSQGQNRLLEKPGRLKTVGDRSFRTAAPKLWNGLPPALRMCDDLDAFKRDLKTHLFRIAFE